MIPPEKFGKTRTFSFGDRGWTFTLRQEGDVYRRRTEPRSPSVRWAM